MANKYYNFYYDPVQQGFDALAWRTLYGSAPVVTNQLTLSNTAVIHLAQILRCDAYFNVTLTAPVSGDDKKFGLIQYNKNAYIYFHVYNDTLLAETSDGVTAYSTPITWATAWSGVPTEFRMKWEAGAVKFYVGGNLQTIIAYSAPLDIVESTVPGDPLSLFLSDFSSVTDLVLNYIDVKEIQSYILLTSNSGVVTGGVIRKEEEISITENITAVGTLADLPILKEKLNISENLTVVKIILTDSALFETLTVSENVVINNPVLLFSLSGAVQNINITEGIGNGLTVVML